MSLFFKQMLKCTALAAFSVGLAVPATLPSVAEEAGELELKLALADSNINPTTDSVLRLADTLGFYKKHGLKVTIVALDGTPQAVAALNSGAVDIADISIDATIRLRADNDVPIRGVVAATLGAPYLIAAKAEIADIAGLAGKSYAIADNGSLDHTLTQVVLAANGLSGEGPQYVAIGAPAVRAQALAAGKVDATTVSYGTFLPIADTPGIHILVSPEAFADAAPEQSKFIAALEGTIAGKREALQRFVDAIVDVSRAMDTDATPWVDAMGTARDDLSKANLEATARFLAGRWCVNGCMNAGKLDQTVSFIYGNPDFKDVKVVPLADITDQSFVDAALAKAGAYAGAGIDQR